MGLEAAPTSPETQIGAEPSAPRVVPRSFGRLENRIRSNSGFLVLRLGPTHFSSYPLDTKANSKGTAPDWYAQDHKFIRQFDHTGPLVLILVSLPWPGCIDRMTLRMRGHGLMHLCRIVHPLRVANPEEDPVDLLLSTSKHSDPVSASTIPKVLSASSDASVPPTCEVADIVSVEGHQLEIKFIQSRALLIATVSIQTSLFPRTGVCNVVTQLPTLREFLVGTTASLKRHMAYDA
ncbi:hypothetical protein BDV93DRAFT_589833 [Ceratobasidium sp. AG-I]|nr:hypothetical protein BDV93DRAFT_589833 [Ceratobasidium sp. AG-I]